MVSAWRCSSLNRVKGEPSRLASHPATSTHQLFQALFQLQLKRFVVIVLAVLSLVKCIFVSFHWPTSVPLDYQCENSVSLIILTVIIIFFAFLAWVDIHDLIMSSHSLSFSSSTCSSSTSIILKTPSSKRTSQERQLWHRSVPHPGSKVNTCHQPMANKWPFGRLKKMQGYILLGHKTIDPIWIMCM